MKTQTSGKNQAGPQKKTGTKKGNGSAATASNNTTATQSAKAKSGRGLANEGTIASYEEER